MVAGCLLCGWAPAASAQTLLAKAPPAAHGSPHEAGHAGASTAAPGSSYPTGHAGTSTAAAGHVRPARGPHSAAAPAPSSGASPHLVAPQTTTGSPGGISFHFTAPGQVGPQATSTSSGSSGGPTAPQTSAAVPSGPAAGGPGPAKGIGKGNIKGSAKGNLKANAKGQAVGDGKAKPGSNRKGNANGKSVGPPSPGRKGKGATGLTRTVAAPLPVQAPTRPERFFSIPLAPLVPAAAASGPLPGGFLPLAPARRAGSQLFHFGASMLPRGWARESLHEADQLKLPIALLVAIAVFMLGQSLVDRRDPKVSEAPERPNDDSLEFE